MKKVVVFAVVLAVSGGAWAAFTVSHSQDIGCIGCHTPHSDGTITAAPLWNSAINSTQTFTAYSNPSTGAAGGTPTGISKLCMGCHDGVTNTSGDGAINGSGDPGYIGTDLSDTHPISMAYVETDPELAAVQAAYDLLDTGAVGGNVECSSCHEVHDSAAAQPALVLSRATLCTTCHLK